MSEKIEKIFEAIGELDWHDDDIAEIMEGFFNSPSEALEKIDTSNMSNEHIDSLMETLGIADQEEDEELSKEEEEE